jgi:hypothetical protein
MEFPPGKQLVIILFYSSMMGILQKVISFRELWEGNTFLAFCQSSEANGDPPNLNCEIELAEVAE